MIIVLEGVDGVGKSSVSRVLNEQLPLSNLLKLSGAPKDVDSSDWMKSTYESLFPFLVEAGNKSHIILDRAWPSEAIYPMLFKNYNPSYIDSFINKVHNAVPTHYVFLYASLDVLEERIANKKNKQPNEKHPNVATLRAVQGSYSAWFMKSASRYPDNFHSLKTDFMDEQDIAHWIMAKLKIIPTYDTTYSSIKRA